MRAFQCFGLPLIGLDESDFAQSGTQFSVGVPPCEIDLLTTIPGLEFSSCWENRVTSEEDGIVVPYLGKADLVEAKKTAGRPQDLADLEELQRATPESDSDSA
ncbi:hypothetical protein [Haloferula sp.]|uniref:hypothetical protein n=1 Tax=Haloferula sp. TaxID=2497595 RepID=UPI003C77E83E